MQLVPAAFFEWCKNSRPYLLRACILQTEFFDFVGAFYYTTEVNYILSYVNGWHFQCRGSLLVACHLQNKDMLSRVSYRLTLDIVVDICLHITCSTFLLSFLLVASFPASLV